MNATTARRKRTIKPKHAAKRIQLRSQADPRRGMRRAPPATIRWASLCSADQPTASAGRGVRALTAVEIEAGGYLATLAIDQLRRPGITTAVRDEPPGPSASGSGDARVW